MNFITEFNGLLESVNSESMISQNQILKLNTVKQGFLFTVLVYKETISFWSFYK